MGYGRDPLTSFTWFLHFDTWKTPARLLDGLPEAPHAARVLAYMTTCIEIAGPRTALAFPDVEDRGQLKRALIHASLIELCVGPHGIHRWRRLPPPNDHLPPGQC